MTWQVEFPAAELAACSQRLAGLNGRRRQARLGFRGASIRWLGVIEHAGSLATAWQEPPGDTLDVIEDIHLFGLFASAVSVMDCLAYAAYALGAIRHRSAFPMDTDRDMRRVDLVRTAALFATEFPGETLTRSLTRAAVSPSLLGIREARNVLAHRATDQRSLVISMKGRRREWSISTRRLGTDTVELTPTYLWAIGQVTASHAARVGCGLDDFTERHFGGR